MRRFIHQIMTDQINVWWACPVKFFLWLLSLGYFVAVKCRAALYQAGTLKKKHLDKPVISVGNITVGGSGKTPMVETLAVYCEEQKRKPVILTRGYMAAARSALSDEAAMLAAHLPSVPVLIGADRWQNAAEFQKKSPVDVFILDDGFQHWRLKRDLDIVLIDATDPWGNGQLIPRGILREPLAALKRADIFVISKSDLGKDNVAAIRNRLNEINPAAVIAEAVHRPVNVLDLRGNKKLGLESVRGKRIALVSSIGDPVSFERTVTALGARIEAKYFFMDHHVYQDEELAAVARTCRDQGISMIITTEKDAVKLKDRWKDFPTEITVGALEIKMTVMDGQEKFFGRIAAVLHR